MQNGQITNGYSSAVAITTSDTVIQGYSAIYVGGAGNITIQQAAGTSVLFTAVPVGSILPVNCVRVMATGTSATALVGLN